MRIKDSVVVITGASSGIGRATALRFATKGAAVVVAGRRESALEDLAAQCRERGAEALAVPTDVGDVDSVEALAQRAVEQFGRIDIWVNDAALTSFGSLLDTPLEDVRRILEVNVMGCVHGARAALRVMRQQGSGVLINVSSVVAAVPQPYTAAYSMSKAAIRSLSGSLRAELALDHNVGIKVCTVLPAAIDTPLFRQAANYTGREVVPMPPVYSAQRVARAIVNLARWPRREVAVGHVGRQLMLQHKVSPGTAEGMMALQVDKTHLSRQRPAAAGPGNLYEPSPAERDTAVDGAWGGRRRTARRRVLAATVLVGAGLMWRRVLR